MQLSISLQKRKYLEPWRSREIWLNKKAVALVVEIYVNECSLCISWQRLQSFVPIGHKTHIKGIMKDFTGMQLTLVCFIAILCLNVLICKGYHHVGSKSIVRERVFKSLLYNANFFNLEKVEAHAPTSNTGRKKALSTSLSMSPSDDGIGKVKHFSITTINGQLYQIIAHQYLIYCINWYRCINWWHCCCHRF